MQDGQQQAHIVMRHITGVTWEGRDMPTQDGSSVAMMQWPGLTAARGHHRAYVMPSCTEGACVAYEKPEAP